MDARMAALSTPELLERIQCAALSEHFQLAVRQHERLHRFALVNRLWASVSHTIDRDRLYLALEEDGISLAALSRLPKLRHLHLAVGGPRSGGDSAVYLEGKSTGAYIQQQASEAVLAVKGLRSLHLSARYNHDALEIVKLATHLLSSAMAPMQSLSELHLHCWTLPPSIELLHMLSTLPSSILHLSLVFSGSPAWSSLPDSPPPGFILRSLSTANCSRHVVEWMLQKVKHISWASLYPSSLPKAYHGRSLHHPALPMPELKLTVPDVRDVIIRDIWPAWGEPVQRLTEAIATLSCVRWVARGETDFIEDSMRAFFERLPKLRTLRLGNIEYSWDVEKLIAAVGVFPPTVQLSIIRGRHWTDERTSTFEDGCRERGVSLTWHRPASAWLVDIGEAEMSRRYQLAMMQSMPSEKAVGRVWLDIFQRE